MGDTLALSVSTPKHLREIGLLDKSTPIDDYETSINNGTCYWNWMLSLKLERFSSIYRLLLRNISVSIDVVRTFFSWRKEYQGIKPPSPRSEENFDAGAKYHFPANVEYLR